MIISIKYQKLGFFCFQHEPFIHMRSGWPTLHWPVGLYCRRIPPFGSHLSSFLNLFVLFTFPMFFCDYRLTYTFVYLSSDIRVLVFFLQWVNPQPAKRLRNLISGAFAFRLSLLCKSRFRRYALKVGDPLFYGILVVSGG